MVSRNERSLRRMRARAAGDGLLAGSLGEAGRLTGRALVAAGDLALEEVVQGRSNGGDGGQTANLVPGRLDGGAQDVRAEQELQGQGQRAPEAQPHGLDGD